jgi:SAM-dependent methyltransferase
MIPTNPEENAMTQHRFNLPYFDTILAHIEKAPASELVRAFGTRHVHWGDYADPATTDDSTEGLMAAAEALTARLVSAAEVKNGQRVLDAGCGFGGTTSYLNEHYSDMDLTGLNIDARQLVHAAEWVIARPGNRVQFIEGDACAMPLPDQTFDAVLAVECIFHFPSRRRFFREARRVLKQGGRLVLSDFVPHGPASLRLAPWVLRNRRAMGRFYGQFNTRLPCTAWGYRLLARLTGFRLLLDADITPNTLPTYPALLRIIRDFGHREAEEATELVAFSARKGWVRYRVLAFEAA